MNKYISGKSVFHLSFLVSASLIGAAGCEVTGPELAKDPAQQLEDDFGGPGGLLEFFESRSEDEIRETLAADEIGYVTQAAITDCPQTFASSFRTTWHSITGEHYYIDSAGRPSKAYSHLPPINSEARNDSCQASVGQWGDAANPSNDYDGGHLIGSQLGGWGARANLVPQEANFNRGNYAQLENKMATCGGLSSGRMLYSITVSYPNSTTLIPSTWNVYIQDRTQGDFVSLNFQNASSGGSNGTNERNRGVNFLSANGCN
jgi:hypothetical protein